MVREAGWRWTAGDWGCLIVTLLGVLACLLAVVWLWVGNKIP